MEVKYNQIDQTYQIIHNGEVITKSAKGQIKSDEEAAIWFEKTIQMWLNGWDSKGVNLQ